MCLLPCARCRVCHAAEQLRRWHCRRLLGHTALHGGVRKPLGQQLRTLMPRADARCAGRCLPLPGKQVPSSRPPPLHLGSCAVTAGYTLPRLSAQPPCSLLPPVCPAHAAGANAGFSTILFKLLWPDATVVMLEPDPSNFAILSRNVAT